MKKSLLILSFCFLFFPAAFAQTEWTYYPQSQCLIMGTDTLRNVKAEGKELYVGENHSFHSAMLGLGMPIQGGYNIVSVQRRAFMNCDSLKLIIFPSTLKTLESEAFAYCKYASIVIMGSPQPPQCDTSTFSHTPIYMCIVPTRYRKIYENPMVFYPSTRKWIFIDEINPSIFNIIKMVVTNKNQLEPEQLDTLPSFPGGMDALVEFMQKNLRYPGRAEVMEIQGTVQVSVIVDKTGFLRDIMVVKSVSKELDAESLRVIKLMPKWEPGILYGEPVDIQVIIPIRFELK